MSFEVSIVIPCLNEEGSIEECVSRAKEAFSGVSLEILVVDNGSKDRSRELAERAGARVLSESRPGYGSAIMCGLANAQGDYLVIGDADNTYDFKDGRDLVALLKAGAEFAIGDRIHGSVEKGAMPWLHRRIGTPILTGVLNSFFGSQVSDINCGLRAIRRECLSRLKLRSPGMEFASEMVIHAQKAGLKIAEKTINYYRRRQGEAKLRTFRDGWRHLRFIMLCAPFPVFIIPSVVVVGMGTWFLLSERLGFQALGGGLIVSGAQVFLFGILAKAILWSADSFLVDAQFGRVLQFYKLEYGILASLFLLGMGFLLIGDGALPGLIRGGWFLSLSLQTLFTSFLLSLLLLKKS